MITATDIHDELEGRFSDIARSVGKHHISVRWEPAPRIVRIGAMVEHYDWDRRMEVLDALVSFERAHVEDFAVEYDVLPLAAVVDEEYAEA